MNPRRDAATVPGASPAPAPRPTPASPAAPPVAQNEPPLEEDVLLRYNRLGRERARRRGRYKLAGFAGVSGLGEGRQQQQAGALLQQQLSEAMAASGALIVESGGAATDTRFEQYREQEFAKQFLERAARQQIKQGGIVR